MTQNVFLISARSSGSGLRRYFGLTFIFTLILVTTDVFSQAGIERDTSQNSPSRVNPFHISVQTTASDDPTLLGVNLKAIILLDNTDGVVANNNAVGIYSEKITHLDTPAIHNSLQKFIGQPLSWKMISEIQTEIAKQSRDMGRSSIYISTPPQEVTSGVLQIRIGELNAGRVVDSNVSAARTKCVGDCI